jgi:Ran GTPase-activating protein 1
MPAWVKAYQANNKVKTVKMVQNGIRQEGVALLLQHGLSACTQLETVDLQDNTFTSLAAKTLANVVPKWTELRDLGVGDCLLSARGGRLLGDALSDGGNKKLEVLRLQYNEIDSKGLKALADAASRSGLPRLRRIELNGNKFNEDDTNIEKLQTILSKRKEEHADEYPGVDEDDEDAWGVDDLDELEEEDEEEDENEVEVEDEEESIVKDADIAEDEPVAQVKDPEVDELADALGKTEIK